MDPVILLIILIAISAIITIVCVKGKNPSKTDAPDGSVLRDTSDEYTKKDSEVVIRGLIGADSDGSSAKKKSLAKKKDNELGQTIYEYTANKNVKACKDCCAENMISASHCKVCGKAL